MIKKLLIIALFGFFLSGCAGSNWNIPAGNTAMSVGIKVGAYNLGYYVGKSKTDADDIAIANAYKLAREGTLSPAEVAAAFAKLKIENAQLAGSLMIILTEMGATFDAGGNLLNLSGIPIEYWDKAAEGYALGYEFGKIGQKDIKSNVSAVKKHMPLIKK